MTRKILQNFYENNPSLVKRDVNSFDDLINIYERALEKEKYKLNYSDEPYDPLIFNIIDKYYSPSEEAKQLFRYHVLFKSLENSFGYFLEDFLESILKKFDWVRCHGEIFKGVDFINNQGIALQIKNKYNTENSSSSAIRNGTNIKKWNRLNKTRENRVPKISTNWQELYEIIKENVADNNKENLRIELTEEKFKDFVFQLIEKNIKDGTNSILKDKTKESIHF